MDKAIRIIDELIFEAQKEPTWKAENALRCLKKELLKEQEAVEPKQIGQGWFCGACDALLSISNEKIVKFCSMCGKPIKWE